jgi:hypothetical protein
MFQAVERMPVVVRYALDTVVVHLLLVDLVVNYNLGNLIWPHQHANLFVV